jgi:hypothetical protein
MEQGASLERQCGVSHVTSSARTRRTARSTRPVHIPWSMRSVFGRRTTSGRSGRVGDVRDGVITPYRRHKGLKKPSDPTALQSPSNSVRTFARRPQAGRGGKRTARTPRPPRGARSIGAAPAASHPGVRSNRQAADRELERIHLGRHAKYLGRTSGAPPVNLDGLHRPNAVCCLRTSSTIGDRPAG